MGMQLHKRLNARELAPRARFELATLRLTDEMIENLSALSGVAHEKIGSHFSFFSCTPHLQPTAITFEWVGHWSAIRFVEVAGPP